MSRVSGNQYKIEPFDADLYVDTVLRSTNCTQKGQATSESDGLFHWYEIFQDQI